MWRLVVWRGVLGLAELPSLAFAVFQYRVLASQVKVSGKTGIPVSGGTVELAAKAAGITVATAKFDICTLRAQMGLDCNIAAGDAYSMSATYLVPGFSPSGATISIQLNIKDKAGNQLSCLAFDEKLAAPAPGLRGEASKPNRRETEFLFEAWRRQHDTVFETAELHLQRLDIFEANHLAILENNSNPASTVTLAHNAFSHMTQDEFAAHYLSLGGMPQLHGSIPFDLDTSAPVAASQDWTTAGAVTRVKWQGQCVSSWAFSTTGSVEGAYFLKTGQLISLSEQQLVDCATSSGEGCNGGLVDSAFSYVNFKGLATEYAYPYKGGKFACLASSMKAAIAPGILMGFTDVPAGDEVALLTAVASRPVSVAIQANQQAFQFYSSGVLTGNCGKQLDHSVLAVGYGTDNGTDYWKVKNSWGSSWGEAGYIRIQRGVNQCGIAEAASYPFM
jgi:hypothetical protein